jgi:hypothetical protein
VANHASGANRMKGTTMIRNLQILGLALVAIFAMSATAASAASQGELTSDGSVSLTGTDSTAFRIKFIKEQEYYCHTHYTIGKEDVTPHGFVTGSLTTLTMAPQFSDCEMVIGANEGPGTFTMNGCDFLLHIGKGEAGVYGTTLDLICPAGNVVEFHSYSNESHTTTVCTFKLGAQTGLTGATAKNTGEGITLNGTFKGIHDTRTGLLCGGTLESKEAELEIDALITGKNAEGKATSISLTG